jgi:hypothetical protein
MDFDTAAPPMRHQIGNRRSIAADDNRLPVFLQSGEQAGKVCLRLVDIYYFHGDMLVQLVHHVNGPFGAGFGCSSIIRDFVSH